MCWDAEQQKAVDGASYEATGSQQDFGEGEMIEMTILRYQVIPACYPQLIEPGVFSLSKLSQSHSLFLRELNPRILRD